MYLAVIIDPVFFRTMHFPFIILFSIQRSAFCSMICAWGRNEKERSRTKRPVKEKQCELRNTGMSDPFL